MATAIPWSNNWQRTYKITLGVREYTPPAEYAPEALAAVTGSTYQLQIKSEGDTIPSEAFTIDNFDDPRGFNFEFENQQVASSAGASTENSHLTLYNLSDEAKRIINQPNCICIIEAGYEGKTVKCYTGDIVSVTPSRNPPDISYRIQLSAQGNVVRNTMINAHYDESLSEKDIIMDMAKRFSGTSLASYGLSDLEDRYKTGGTGATGSLITNFDAHMKKNGLEYTFSNNKLFIIPYRLQGVDYDRFSRTNYTLSEGNIKSVAPVNDFTKKSSDDPQNKIKKLQVNTFYLPIDVGQFITIPTTDTLKEYAGTYIVKGRRVILQSKGNAWDIVLNVEELSQ